MIAQALRTVLPAKAAFGILAGVLERAVQYGTLELIDPWGERHLFGTTEAPFVTVRITDVEEPARLLSAPSVRAGEAYMEGTLLIEQGTLRDFLLIGVAAARQIDEQAGLLAGLSAPFRKLKRQIPIARARANAAHHYDIAEELYRLFLDDDMQYSCAYFQTGNETLEEAQTQKKHHLAAKLRLKPGARVLDIGSGWGGLALELARRHDVQVDGLTLSQEQLGVARARADQEGLQERVHFHLRDYRQEVGAYDLVSVGMFEHVGAHHFAEFFEVVRRSLAPDGVAVIHAIGSKDAPGECDPWIDKYIFPGGYCPALSEVLTAVEKAGLWVTDVEILRLHYAETLRHWSERFRARRKCAAEIYDERFCRMWEYYLAVCEAGFRVGSLMVFQIQLARTVAAVPLVRDYIADEKRRPEFMTAGGLEVPASRSTKRLNETDMAPAMVRRAS
jgi:cyclopropane-fatty-acyl-phospholipid synthase